METSNIMPQIFCHIVVQQEDFDICDLIDTLANAQKNTSLEEVTSPSSNNLGALASFVGYCRDEGGRLAALELEHYPLMAAEELQRIAQEAWQRWALLGVVIVHRYGKILPGERIVFVAASSSHRRDSLNAVDFMMDFLKSRAPFWKKEHWVQGQAPSWVCAKAEDETALKAW